jgi:hypothetical protein
MWGRPRTGAGRAHGSRTPGCRRRSPPRRPAPDRGRRRPCRGRTGHRAWRCRVPGRRSSGSAGSHPRDGEGAPGTGASVAHRAGGGHTQRPQAQDGAGGGDRRRGTGLGARLDEPGGRGALGGGDGGPPRPAQGHRGHRRGRPGPHPGPALPAPAADIGPVGPQPARALGLLHTGRRRDPGLVPALGVPGVGRRLRARPRAGPPGHGPAFWSLVHRYRRAERARGFLLAKSQG